MISGSSFIFGLFRFAPLLLPAGIKLSAMHGLASLVVRRLADGCLSYELGHRSLFGLAEVPMIWLLTSDESAGPRRKRKLAKECRCILCCGV